MVAPQVITSRSIMSIEKWTNHIKGAAALLELRGPEHLQSEEGLKLFVQLRFQIVCLGHCPPTSRANIHEKIKRSPAAFKEEW